MPPGALQVIVLGAGEKLLVVTVHVTGEPVGPAPGEGVHEVMVAGGPAGFTTTEVLSRVVPPGPVHVSVYVVLEAGSTLIEPPEAGVRFPTP